MKNLIPACLLALLFSSSVQAAGYVDYAQVISVVPQYERINLPRKECNVEVVQETQRPRQRDYGGAIIGGVAGALLGNQVGGGHGKEAATAVGAVVGALAGDRIAANDSSEGTETVPREIRRCRTVDDWQSRIAGYRVTYDYHGQRQSLVMPYDPGRQLRVSVAIDPLL